MSDDLVFWRSERKKDANRKLKEALRRAKSAVESIEHDLAEMPGAPNTVHCAALHNAAQRLAEAFAELQLLESYDAMVKR